MSPPKRGDPATRPLDHPTLLPCPHCGALLSPVPHTPRPSKPQWLAWPAGAGHLGSFPVTPPASGVTHGVGAQGQTKRLGAGRGSRRTPESASMLPGPGAAPPSHTVGQSRGGRPGSAANEGLRPLVRHTRSLLPHTGRLLFRLAGLETSERLHPVARGCLVWWAERSAPRLAQGSQGLQAALSPFAAGNLHQTSPPAFPAGPSRGPRPWEPPDALQDPLLRRLSRGREPRQVLRCAAVAGCRGGLGVPPAARAGR